MIQPMLEDKREIKSIFREYSQYKVGLNDITKIEIYPEPGQMGFINYAALYRHGILFARIDLSGWGVEYFE
jgi:hypothetical protein